MPLTPKDQSTLCGCRRTADGVKHRRRETWECDRPDALLEAVTEHNNGWRAKRHGKATEEDIAVSTVCHHLAPKFWAAEQSLFKTNRCMGLNNPGWTI